jgi:hypothetical protein
LRALGQASGAASGNVCLVVGHRDLLSTGRHRLASASGGPLLEPRPGPALSVGQPISPLRGRQGARGPQYA